MRQSFLSIRKAEFIAWLEKCGVELEAPTNEWEIIRYRFNGKFQNAYTNKKGRITLCGPFICAQYEAFANGQEPEKPTLAADSDSDFLLYTDASLRSQSKSGAWAGILVSKDGEPIEAHGPLKGQISSSGAAEAMAVANALHSFSGKIPDSSSVCVILDNLGVCNNLNRHTKSKSPQIKGALKYIDEIARDKKLSLGSQWIKGHQSALMESFDPRIKFNNRADFLAGVHGRKLHNKRGRQLVNE